MRNVLPIFCLPCLGNSTTAFSIDPADFQPNPMTVLQVEPVDQRHPHGRHTGTVLGTCRLFR